ncbi:MAG: hypothetical protein ACLP1Y_02605 [Candidatus Acidiferrales bacterium]
MARKARRRKISAREFSKEFTRILENHLASLPTDEQDRSIRAAQRVVANRFREIEVLLRGGETVKVTMRKRVIASLVPSNAAAPSRRPDFLARLKKLYRGKPLRVAGAELVSHVRG